MTQKQVKPPLHTPPILTQRVRVCIWSQKNLDRCLMKSSLGVCFYAAEHTEEHQPTFQSSAVSPTVVSRVCWGNLALIQHLALNSLWNIHSYIATVHNCCRNSPRWEPICMFSVWKSNSVHLVFIHHEFSDWCLVGLTGRCCCVFNNDSWRTAIGFFLLFFFHLLNITCS